MNKTPLHSASQSGRKDCLDIKVDLDIMNKKHRNIPIAIQISEQANDCSSSP